MPKSLIILLFAVVIVGIAVGVIIFAELLTLDVTSKAAVLGVLAGGFMSVLTVIGSSAVSLWLNARETSLKLKEKISDQAMQLARMDYDLRLKSNQDEFLAPAKVYREYYLALDELVTKGSWPKKIEELGLLNIFKLK